MAEIVNLRQVRKDRARAEKRAGALKLLEMVRNARAETELDGHLRESGVE
jgi:hypothetical protein